jgi:hypothetical protein
MSDKNKICKNCKASLEGKELYCWNCGQKTKDIKLNFWHFISEFFSTIFNIDNKFFQTVIKLFIPAKLTIDFFNGIRKKYHHPFRIYFVSILLLFFIISRVQPKTVDHEGEVLEVPAKKVVEIPTVIDSVSSDNSNSRFLKKNQVKKFGKRLVGFGDSERSVLYKQKGFLKKEFENYKTKLASDTTKAILDSLLDNLYFVLKGDTLLVRDTSELVPYSTDLWHEEVELSFDDKFFNDIDSVVGAKNLKSWIDRMYLKRKLVLTRGDFNQALYANLTWLFLALVPIHALILRVVYYRKKQYFIEHYVFLLELYSAVILIFTANLVFLPLFQNASQPLTFAFAISSIFALVSFKRYYDQSWVAIILKFLLVGFLFFFSAIFTLVSFAILVAMFF